MDTKWNLKGGNFIIHRLTGDNFSITHGLIYSSYENKKIMDKYKKKKENSKL